MKSRRSLTLSAAMLVTAIEVLTLATVGGTVAADDTQVISVVTAPLPREETVNTHVSLAGLGSLVWAARNPAQAWKVLTPIQPGDIAYADLRAKCAAAVTGAAHSAAVCP